MLLYIVALLAGAVADEDDEKSVFVTAISQPAVVPEFRCVNAPASHSRCLFGQHLSCANQPCTSTLAPDVV